MFKENINLLILSPISILKLLKHHNHQIKVIFYYQQR